MALQLVPKRRTLSNPSLIHLFSTSSSSSSSIPADSDDRNDHSKSSTSDSPLSSYLSDVKASLSRQLRSSPPPLSPRTSRTPASKGVSVEEIRKNLAEFRRISDPTPPANSGSTPSFHDLYKQNVVNNADDRSSGWRLSMDVIRRSLNQMRASNNAPQTGRGGSDPLSLSSFKSSLRLRPSDSPSALSDSPSAPSRTTVFGGTDPLPQSVFGKEIRERKDGYEPSTMKRMFVKRYDHQELGKRLKQLRPDEKDKGEGWFSIEELNQRLTRLRELEEKEPECIISGMQISDLRSGLEMMKRSDDEKNKTNLQKHGILGLMSRTPEFMLQPPKEHLVEKYFHPDNMSSAEKMKLELAKVRNEFKLSESDCGSARVQVAQLTTKIKHLSAVLHKKDKHSRKGLVAMVQRRKRLLKYLRRTDWDSYCFVLDKLGLRDNPDYKN